MPKSFKNNRELSKKIILVFAIILVIHFLGRDLNPFSSNFFLFHDETQPARIHQFTKEIKNLNIPPRIASDMNFGIGYPIFNFYAPLPYVVTSFFHLIGFSIPQSLKISFLMSLIIGFLSMFLFLNLFYNFNNSLIGAVLYITSLYFPINIFVRGNLGELWFLALFPLGLYFLNKSNQKKDKKFFLTKIIILSFLLISHNILSFFFVLFSIFFIFFYRKGLYENIISLLVSFTITAFFWLPVIFEKSLVWAEEVATQTKYADHFLCLWQLWDSPWGFGGSAKGCVNDGMSFKIGKIQIIFFLFSLFLFLLTKKKGPYKSQKISSGNLRKLVKFFSIYTIFLLFMTTHYSAFIWKIADSFLKLFQFPWRLIGPSLVGIVFISVYGLESLSLTKRNLITLLLMILILFTNGKYFSGQKISNTLFETKYLSEEYIKNQVTYKVPEYLPKTNSYSFWRQLENKKPTQEEINILTLEPFKKNNQTPIQKISNLISLLALLVIIIMPNKFYNIIQAIND